MRLHAPFLANHHAPPAPLQPKRRRRRLKVFFGRSRCRWSAARSWTRHHQANTPPFSVLFLLMMLPPQPWKFYRSQSGIAGYSRRAQRREPFPRRTQALRHPPRPPLAHAQMTRKPNTQNRAPLISLSGQPALKACLAASSKRDGNEWAWVVDVAPTAAVVLAERTCEVAGGAA